MIKTYNRLKLAITVSLSCAILSSTLAGHLPSPSNPEEEEISVIVRQIEEYDFNKEYEFSLVSTLMRYWNEKGEYPASLDDLKLYEPKVRIDDPFNLIQRGEEVKRQPFKYKKAEISECYIWSIGPDGIDNHHIIEYNPKKRWRSNGDIGVRIIKNDEKQLVERKDQNPK